MEASASSAPTLFESADEWFARAHALLRNALPCRQGCCRCCIGPFPITQLDVIELRRGLSLLPQEQRAAIQAKATQQVAEMEAAYPALRKSPNLDQWDDAALDALVTCFADMPCPALEPDGSCGMYAFRPITCRMMGIPTESDGLVQGACSVQTAIPIIRLPNALREEEDRLAEREAAALTVLEQMRPGLGEEVLLPYGFRP